MGRVIVQGQTRVLAGEPQSLGGYRRERFVYAPSRGLFRTHRRIGDRVAAGDRIADPAGRTLHAPLSGHIRGLTHAGVVVEANAKVIEIGPQINEAAVFCIGERPRRIAAGVLYAIEHSG